MIYLGNPEPSFEIVTLEVPSHSIEELRVLLGSFTLNHGGKLVSIEPPSNQALLEDFKIDSMIHQ